jgi:hypothetical protein
MDKVMFEKLMKDAGFELQVKTENEWQFERSQSVVNCRLDEEFALWIRSEDGYIDVCNDFSKDEITIVVSSLLKACMNEEIQRYEQIKPVKKKWWLFK